MEKTLVKCKPTEFLKQTVRIKRLAEKWLEETEIIKIRSERPKYKPFPKGISEEERQEISIENGKIAQNAVYEKLSRIFDNIAEKSPDDTLSLLALCCFVEPEDVDKYEMGEYIGAIASMMGDENVINFFISLARLEQPVTWKA